MEFGELRETVVADVARCVGAVDTAAVDALVGALAAKRKVFLIGTGRSGKMLEAMAIRLGHLGVAAYIVGTPDCPVIRDGDLALVGSGSGNTPVPLDLAVAARGAGARLAAITADRHSPVAELAHTLIHIPAPVRPRDGTPHTLRSLFEECLLIVCDCVCRMLQDRLGLSTDEMQARHAPDR